MSTDCNTTYTTKQFTQDCLRTESLKPEIKINKELLTNTTDAIISLGNVLDQIKKHAFYGDEYDHHKLINLLNSADDSIENIKNITTEDIDKNEQSINTNTRLFHSIIGSTTESVELLEALDLYGNNNEDLVNISEEFADQLFYIAVGADTLNISIETMMTTVISKLKERFPDKFTEFAAIHRNTTKERKILESGMKTNLDNK